MSRTIIELPTEKGYGKNKNMNNETYALRRRVMDLIYEVKGTVDMERVNVRIIEENCGCKKHVVGVAQTHNKAIYIPESTINMGDDYLRNVVIHELGHAMFDLRHDESCPIMSKCMPKTPLTKDQCHEIIKGWVE